MADPMTTLEARIAEVLAEAASAHRLKKAEQMNTDYPHAWCLCGVQTIGIGEFPEHIRQATAAMLAPVIREAQAKVLTEFADAHRMPEPLFMDDGRAVTVGDLLREKAAQLRSNDE